MHRTNLLACAALASLTSPTLAANASTGCPLHFDGEPPLAWGPVTRVDDNAGTGRPERVHEPRGLRMIDRPVSYVSFMADYEWTVHYRLEGEVHTEGQPLSQKLLEAFLKSYPKATCNQSVWNCRAPLPSAIPVRSGHLSMITLTADDTPASDVAEPEVRNSTARKIEFDKKLSWKTPQQNPVFLVCKYWRK
jgi:hypothetical protein